MLGNKIIPWFDKLINKMARTNWNLKPMKPKREETLDKIFSIIKSLSKQDLRVGQIIVNVVLSDFELFYMEDDELLEALKSCYGNMI